MKKYNYLWLMALVATLLAGCVKSEEPEYEIEPTSYTSKQVKSSKRGISYNMPYAEDFVAFQSGVSWFYNWGPDFSSDLFSAASNASMLFYPMAWNGGFDANRIRKFKLSHPTCEYILAFNEPNLTDQANMTPKQAAAFWPALRDLATELNMKLVSPAMNWGTLKDYADPIKWLDEFFQLVPISDIDVIAIHCYMGAPSPFKAFVNSFKKYNKPIWVTEFCAWETNIKSSADQMKYMIDVVSFLEKEPMVERYAWFIPRYGNGKNYPYMQLLSQTGRGNLTDLGKMFVNLSSLDKNTHYVKGDIVPAAHYSAMEGVDVQLSTDVAGVIEVAYFSFSKWLEYPVEVATSGNFKVDFRHASKQPCTLEVFSNDKMLSTHTIEATGDFKTWKTSTLDLTLPAGRQTLRFRMVEGDINFNWWRFR